MGTITKVFGRRGYGFSYLYEVLFPEVSSHITICLVSALVFVTIHTLSFLIKWKVHVHLYNIQCHQQGQDLGGCLSLKADVKHIHSEVSKVKKSHTNVCDKFKGHFI